MPAKLIGPLPWPRTADDGTQLGIDLGRPLAAGRPVAALEVQAIVFKFLEGQRVPFDRDDLLQEVLIAIHRRNRYPSAYDPRLATLGKYVWLVCRNILGHMLQRAERSEAEVSVEELPDAVDDQAERAFDRVEWEHGAVDAAEPVKPLAKRGPRRRRTVEFERPEPGESKKMEGGGKVVPFKRSRGWEQLALPWAA